MWSEQPFWFPDRVVGCRKHFFHQKFAYYCNTSASFQLRNILGCGDVHPNPCYGCDTSASNGERGRKARKPPTWKYPCAACSKPIRSNQKGILCDGCCKWHHIKCVNMDHKLYRELSSDDTWFCTNCSFPFNFMDSFFEEPVTSEEAPVTITLDSNPTDNITTGRQSLFPKVLALNSTSIRNKVFDLQALYLTDCVDIIALPKTWLDDNFLDSQLHLNDYNIFRKDRSHHRRGGVLLAIKDPISCVLRRDLETESEMLALEIHPNPTCSILFAVFYRPPNADESFLADFRYFLDKYSGTGLTNLVVVGDFNFPNIDWNLGCPTGSDPETVEFCNDKFQDMLFCGIDHHIPQRTLKRRSSPPWIDNETMKLIRKKKKLWKRLKTNGSADLFLKFKDLRRKTKKLITSSFQQYLQSLSGKLQTKRSPEIVIYRDTRSRDLNSKVELFDVFFIQSTLNPPLMLNCWLQMLLI